MIYTDSSKRRKKNNATQTWFTVGLISVVAIVLLAVFILIADDGSSAVESFLDLDDTPGSYVGANGYLVGVNGTATGLDFVNPGSAGFQLVWYKINADSGSVAATTIADTLIVSGGTNVGTSIISKTLSIYLDIDSQVDFNGQDAINIDSLIGNSGNPVRVGTPASSHGVTGINSLLIGNNLEVDGVTWLDGGLQVTGPTAFSNSFTVVGDIGVTGDVNASGTITAQTGFDGLEHNSINDLGDVNTGTWSANASVDDVLTWDGSNWIPGTISQQDLFNVIGSDSGTVTASSPTTTLIISGGTDVTTSVSGNILTISYTGIAAGTPSLQDVTDVGATTTNSITVNGLTSGGVIIAHDDVTIDNAQPLEWEDSGGTQRRVLRLGAGDNVRLTNDAGGNIILETDDSNGPGNLITRLTVSGSENIASATWSDIVHVGFELGGDMDGGGYDISNVATMSATAFEGSGYSLTGLTLWHLEDTNTGTDNAIAADGQALVWDAANSWWEPGTVAGSTPNLQQVTDVGYVTTNPMVSGTHTATDFIIPSWALGTPTYDSLNDFFTLFNSAGRITGGGVTAGVGETVDVAAGTGLIRVADDDVSQVKFFNWSGTNCAIPTDTVRYVGIEYNGGAPIAAVRTNNDFDLDTEFLLASIVNEGGTIHILEVPWWTSDGLTNVIERFRSYGWLTRDDYIGGLILGTTGTRNVTVTAGTLWSHLTEYAISAFDSSGADIFETYWYNGVAGDWNTGTESQYSVSQWNNTTLAALQNLNNNWYANWWVYVEADDDEIALVYPQAQYANAASAEAESPPTLIPTHISEHAILIGRILFQEGNDTPVEVQTTFDTVFNAAQAADHGNLAGLNDNDHPQYEAFNILLADSGSTTADTNPDTLTVSGTQGISTSISGDTLTISFTGSSGTPTLDDVTTAGNTTTNSISTGTITAVDVIIPDWQTGSPTYYTLNDFFKLFNSAGRITGGEITQVGTSTSISVAAGTGLIRIADDDVSQVKFVDWISSGTVVPTDDILYVGVVYSGTTDSVSVVYSGTQVWDLDTEFPLGSIINQEDTLYILNNPWWISDGMTNIIERFEASGYLYRDRVVGGLDIGVTGTRNPTLTAGKIWSRLTEFDITAKDCSGADGFYAFYRDGAGGWTTSSLLHQYPVLYYDNNSGSPVAMNPNTYANWWVFLVIEEDVNGQLMFMYPQQTFFTSGEAESADIPDIPDAWYEHGMLIGRIVFEQGTNEPVLVESTFDPVFEPGKYVLYDGSRDPDVAMDPGDEFTVQGDAFEVAGSSKLYTGSNSPLTMSGTNYYTAGDVSVVYGIWDAAWTATVLSDSGVLDTEVDGLDETYGDINAYAVDALGDDSVLLTVYSNSGTDSAIVQLISTFTGTLTAQVEHSWKPAFSQDPSGFYAWVGTPSVAAPSGSTSWPDPPYLEADQIALFRVDSGTTTFRSENATIFESDLMQVTDGKVLFGSSVVPFLTDYLIQAFKNIANPGGNVAGMLFGFQDSSSSDFTDQMWGISTGMSLYGDANYSIIRPLYNSIRLDNNDKTVNIMSMVDATLTLASGAHSGSQSNVNLLTYYGAGYSREGGSPLSSISQVTLFNDGTAFDCVVGSFYGLYIRDHSAEATASWGIYNLDRSYFGRQLELQDNSYILFEGTLDDFETIVDAVNPTQDNTIYFPNASGTVALTSDLSGTVSYEIVLTPGGGIVPTTNGAEQVQTDGTNMSYYTLAFDPSLIESSFWEFIIPDTYTGGTITPTISWVGTPVAGDVIWGVRTVGRTDSEQYDVALGGTQTVTTTIDGTTLDINTSTITGFDPGWDAGDIVIWQISRIASSGSDTMVGDADMIMAKIEWPANKE